MEGFNQYLRRTYGVASGTANSYIMAIRILDNIFEQYDVLNFAGNSIVTITDAGVIYSLYEFVKAEEKKMKDRKDSIFKFGKPTQRSYPRGGFCSAAVRSLFNYREAIIQQKATEFVQRTESASKLIKKLKTITSISNTDVDAEIHQRIGQNVFRSILLEIYNGQCCVCGLNIKELLRASHILPWSESKPNRLNPENGLCLSATYDAAFDKYLISFDEDYRMIVSPYIRDFYTNETAKEYFEKYEGKQLTLPYKFNPSKEFLSKHREKVIG
ncbi:MAG: HNH endonuclease [Muribaculaceae bacterium]